MYRENVDFESSRRKRLFRFAPRGEVKCNLKLFIRESVEGFVN